MRYFALLAVCGFAAISVGQSLPKLEKSIPIDMHVSSVDWHPKGKALIYSRKDGAGRALGVYSLGQEQGKTLLPLAKDDRYEISWFSGKPNALVTTYRPLVEDGVAKTRIEVALLDAEHQTSRTIFSRVFDGKEKAGLDTDTSPSLLHAIITLRTVAGLKHFILKTGSFDIIPSLDLDKAAEQGISGPNWSLDGTAIYANGAVTALRSGSFEVVNGTVKVAEETAVIDRKIELTTAFEVKLSLDSLSAGNALRLRFTPPPPPLGATVLELMPQNATLRQVRFKGAWNEVAPNLTPITSQNIAVNLNFGRSKGQTNSVWLTGPKQQAETGVLVTPFASQAWIAPRHTSVAYLTDGVLFIRVIGPG